MSSRASMRDTAVELPRSLRWFAFETEYHPGFSRSVYIRLWKMNLTISSYEGSWYVALMWA